MIFRHLQIENWRGIERFEVRFEAGLNVLQGPNEAGKSSLVEALEWALARDVVGGARIKDEIEGIVPAHAPNLKPQVSLRLDFHDCSATICKTLAPESNGRDCKLTIQRPGGADEYFDREAAQTRLRALLWNDALETLPSKSAPESVDAAMLFAHQGEAEDYVASELSPAARSTLVVSEDGGVAPTSRLEKVRREVVLRRGRELKKKLGEQAIDAAREDSEAAPLRDALRDLRQQHAKFQQIDRAIDDLRNQIGKLRDEVETLRQCETMMQTRATALREQRSAQQAANGALSAARLAGAQANAARDDWKTLVGEVARLRGDLERGEREVGIAQEHSDKAAQELKEIENAANEAGEKHALAAKSHESARAKLDAFIKYRALKAANRERKTARVRLEELGTLQAERDEARREMQQLGLSASREQIWKWREDWGALNQKKQDIAAQLRVTLAFERLIEIEWRADDEEPQHDMVGPDEELLLSGGASIVVVLPGIGEIRVGGAGRETRKLAEEIEERARVLSEALAPFGIELSALPDGFNELQERGAKAEQIGGENRTLNEKWAALVASHGTLELLRQDRDETQQAWESARAECESVLSLLPQDVANLSREELSEGHAEAQEAESLARGSEQLARKVWEERGARGHEARLEAARREARAQGLAAIVENTRRELTRHLEREPDDDKREAHLEECAQAAWRAGLDLKEAEDARAALGEEIHEADARAAQTAHEAAAFQLQHAQSLLQEKRSELKFQAEQDPRTEMERLEWEIEARAVELEKHEARLRGMALLEAAIEAERHKLGRRLAGPLNAQLSPWLSQIRGKETLVEFDDNGRGITRVRTTQVKGEESQTVSLRFGEHSEGMKEQVALVMRLILARLAAQRLPTRKLPIILDDPLTQSDAQRREGLYQVLNEAAQELQIVFVTCHEGHAAGLNGVHPLVMNETAPQVITQTPPLNDSNDAAPVVEAKEEKVVRPRRKKIEKVVKPETEAREEAVETLSLW